MSSFQLKLLASVCMLLDHAAVALLEAPLLAVGFEPFVNMLPGTPLAGQAVLYTVLRLIGRLAFPIYAFQLAQGSRLSHRPERYVARLALFALISEVPFDLALRRGWPDWSAQNVYLTLALGAAALLLFSRDWPSPWLSSAAPTMEPTASWSSSSSTTSHRTSVPVPRSWPSPCWRR